jgi:DNA-binding LacI/PurR family transcriptional regulator
MLREKRVDGIILAGTALPPKQLEMLRKSNIPIAAVDRSLKLHQVDTVFGDNLAGARSAVLHLLSLGHRRIAVISGPAGVSTSRARLEGARAAMSENRAELSAVAVENGDFQMQGGFEATKRLLARLAVGKVATPTAIFAANDQMAAGVILALRESGLGVPDEVSVAGYDDIPWAKLLSPPLTTVAQPAYELGRTAVELLIGRITAPDRPTSTVVLQPTLIVRESTASISE